MSNWPPSAAELWAAAPNSHVSLYDVNLWSELNSGIAYLDELDEEEQHELRSLVRWLDMIAGQAQNNIRNSPWDEGERRFCAPPPQACKDKRTLKAWNADHTDQLCIDAARRAREAVFAGRWIVAASAALETGQHSRARYAEMGWNSRATLPRKGSHRTAKGMSDRDRRIAEEAATLHASKPGLSDSAIAERIGNRHAAERGFPQAGRIRQILRHDKSWKRKACISNNRQTAHCKPDCTE